MWHLLHNSVYHKPQLEKHLNTPLQTLGQFCQQVESKNAKFGYIRYAANASKHVTI